MDYSQIYSPSPHQYPPQTMGEPPAMQNFYNSPAPPLQPPHPPAPQPSGAHPYQSGLGHAPVPMLNPHMQPPPPSMQPQTLHPQPVMLHQRPPSQPPQNHIHPHQFGRHSPYSQSILQTEMRIIEFNRRLQSRPIQRNPHSPLPDHSFDASIWWEKFASEFFDDDAKLTIRIIDDKPIDFTIGRTLIPRFFRSYFDGGVNEFTVNLRNSREIFNHPNIIILDCDRATITTSNNFRHHALIQPSGLVVQTEGRLILDFVSNSFEPLLIKSWQFFTKDCRDFIDKSLLTAIGFPNPLHLEPATRLGLTKSTISYLKMCMIIEPMQEVMSHHKQSTMGPRECLRHMLFDKYRYRCPEDNRAAPNKRRKRKTATGPGAPTTAATNKRSKANANSAAASDNANINSNNGITNANFNNGSNNSANSNSNVMISPGVSNFNLNSQDVMVVGEPSMMGGEFGDDNERMITRLKNTQYEQSAPTPLNAEESENFNLSAGNEKCLPNNGSSSHSNTMDSNLENHNLSPSLMQPRSQQQQQQQNQQVSQHLPTPMQVIS